MYMQLHGHCFLACCQWLKSNLFHGKQVCMLLATSILLRFPMKSCAQWMASQRGKCSSLVQRP